MQLTDEEIRAILIQERRRKKQKQKIRRRITLFLSLALVVVITVIVLICRSVFSESKGVIFLDPGHGGVDSGSCVGDRYEKDDNLSLALAVQKDLEQLGYEVVMSRTDDSDVGRAERGRMANQAKAQLFISIHRNKADEGNGVEVYIPSSNSNEAQLLGNNIMKALVSQGFMERSVRAGTLVSANEDYYENSVPNMTSCLVEIGFMQDKDDNALLDNNKAEIAEALASAIDDTFTELFEQEE